MKKGRPGIRRKLESPNRNMKGENEEALRRLESQLRQVEATAHLGHYEIDVRTESAMWSNEIFNIFGMDPSKDVPLTVKEYAGSIHPDDVEYVYANFRESIAGKNNLGLAYRIKTVEGTLKYVRSESTPVVDDAGIVRKIFGTLQDITEEKAVEKNLIDALEWQNAVLEGSRDAIFVTDSNAGIVAVNQAACVLTGYSKEELLAMRIPDLHEEIDLTAYTSSHDRILKGEEVLNEAKILRKDRRKVPTEFSNKRLLIDGVVYMHTTARNISERKRAEEHTHLLAEVLASVDDAVTVTDAQNRFLFVNEAFEHLYGYRSGELAGQSTDVLLARSEQRSTVDQIAAATVTSGWFGEIVNRRKDGSEFPIELRTSAVRGSDGEVLYFVGVARDITARRKAEEALGESEERFRSIFNESPLGIAVIDSDSGQFLQVNGRYAEIAGRTIDEMKQIGFQTITHPEDLQSDLANMAKLKKGLITQFRMEKRYCRPDSSVVWVELTVVPLWRNRDTLNEHLAMVQEITARKESENRLRNALLEAERFRAALDRVPAHVYMKDTEGRYLYANRLTLDLFGCSEEELVRSDDTRFFPPETVRHLKDIDLRVIAGEQNAEEVVVEKAGSEKVFYWEVKTPIYAEPERKTIIGLLGISTDVSNQKQIEETLRRSEERYKELFENSGTGVVIVDREGIYRMVNRKAAEQFGKRAEEIEGQSMFTVLDREEAQRYLELNRLVIDTAGHREYEDTFILNGAQKAFLIVDQCLRDVSGHPFAVQSSSIDISDRVRAEQKLKQKLIELERWQGVTLGRESRVQELKQEVNNLLDRLGEPRRYSTMEQGGSSV